MDYLSSFTAKSATAIVLAGLMLTGCASQRSFPGNVLTADDYAAMPASQKAVMSQRLQTSYERAPGNLDAGFAYSEYLKSNGRYQQANTVMKAVAESNPNSGEAQLYYAKTLAALGYFPDALRTVRKAEKLSPGNWRVYSEEGLVLDQLGKATEARMRYREALRLSPNNPEVLSNMATSYVLTHDLTSAERYLRQALAQKGAADDVRVNLALVLALQGKREEAQRVAVSGVSPEQGRENIEALNAATAPGGAWDRYAASAPRG